MRINVDTESVAEEKMWNEVTFSCEVDSNDTLLVEGDGCGATFTTKSGASGTEQTICLSLGDTLELIEALNKVSGILWRG